MFQYNEIKNPVFKYSALAVGTALILGIIWLFNQFYNAFDIGRGGSHYNSIYSIASPNENHIATSYVKMGGGAAGWCYQIVEIRKPNEPFPSDKEIFRTTCGGQLQVNWANDTNLNIAYSEGLPFESKAEWNRIKISYSLIRINK